MNYLLALFLFVFNVQAEVKKDKLLSEYCSNLNGEVVNSYKCPKSKLKIPFQFCTYKNDLGEDQFFDGCTGPTGGHSSLFYPHCIKHDLCYHHEPSTNGKSQKTCDVELRDGLISSCSAAKNPKTCEMWAKTMYRAVRSFGALAYNCADYRASY